ncbi:MAG: hypothetical protein ACD_75C00732G0001, partial [uncultured bacterium]
MHWYRAMAFDKQTRNRLASFVAEA